jgi:hypothetical protein
LQLSQKDLRLWIQSSRINILLFFFTFALEWKDRAAKIYGSSCSFSV